MRTHLIGVPSGIGDIYWCLTKIAAYRKAHKLEHVTLGIQQTQHDRSIDWLELAPKGLVDDARYVAFRPDGLTLRNGFTPVPNRAGLDAIMWPNAVVDAGRRLETWLPDLETDLSLELRTERPAVAPCVVLYASSVGVNKAWFPEQRIDRWIELALALTARFETKPLLIGSSWDAQHCEQLRPYCDELIARTSLRQVAGILETATLVVGIASGMTILANHFGTPCVAFFPDKHHVDFPVSWTRPGLPYWPVFARQLRGLSGTAIAQQAAFVAAGVEGIDAPGAEVAVV